jgi:UDP-glucose 4-epimerase
LPEGLCDKNASSRADCQMKQRILLTGASGTLGRNFLELAGDSDQLEILALLREESRQIKPFQAVRESRVDFKDMARIADVVAEFAPRTIIHCAATGMEFPRTEWFDLVRFNVNFSVSLCEIAAASGGCHFVFVGTGMAYKPISRGITEKDPLDTLHPYGASKAAADMLVRSAAVEFGLPLTVLRPFSFTGLGDDRSRLFPSLLRAASAGETLALTSGTQIRDHTSARDIARGILAAAERPPAPAAPQIYNLGSGSFVPVRELVRGVVDELGLQVELKFGAKSAGPHEPPCLVADAARAQEELGWRPMQRMSHAVWELACESFPELKLAEPQESTD